MNLHDAQKSLDQQAAEIARLKEELAQARETNRSLHRRTQEAERNESRRTRDLQRRVANQEILTNYAIKWWRENRGKPPYELECQLWWRAIDIIGIHKAECDAEIARLREENERLREEMARLQRVVPACAACGGRGLTLDPHSGRE